MAPSLEHELLGYHEEWVPLPSFVSPPAGISPGLLLDTAADVELTPLALLKTARTEEHVSTPPLAPPMTLEPTFGSALGAVYTSFDVKLRASHQWATDECLTALSWKKVTALFVTHMLRRGKQVMVQVIIR